MAGNGNGTALATQSNASAPLKPDSIWTPEDKKLIQDTVAKGTNESEFKLFLYTAAKYQLDPLVKQVWCVKYDKSQPASIFTGRDGFLSIAHRSGTFDGMESGAKEEGKEILGWCRVYRTDMTHPFYVEVPLKEYNTGKNLWRDKPRTMIQKVAESQCLRKAFDISGIYSPDEINEIPPAKAEPKNITPPKDGPSAQGSSNQKSGGDESKRDEYNQTTFAYLSESHEMDDKAYVNFIDFHCSGHPKACDIDKLADLARYCYAAKHQQSSTATKHIAEMVNDWSEALGASDEMRSDPVPGDEQNTGGHAAGSSEPKQEALPR